ncbi:MAG: glycine/sarcosine/betaine reductase selenoprotein B family protein [Acidimicrobiia bacterium]
MTDASHSDGESLESFRKSFYYGSRNDLNFKFFNNVDDDAAADLLQELLALLGDAYDTGDIGPRINAAYEAQIAGYAPKPDAPESPHSYDSGPFTPTAMPAAGSTVGLITSSGHFVEGDDPEPFGVEAMTQQEAMDRINEFLRETPELSEIPSQTPRDQLMVRHGGYDITSAARDPNVAFPIDRLAEAVAAGRIGGVTSTYFSFPGATAQGRLKREFPTWLDRIGEEDADIILLVPV